MGSKATITFRIDPDKRTALDELSVAMDRDRSYILNEAIDAYLEVHQWQLDHIKAGIQQAEAGEFASEEEVTAAFARWRQ